MSRIIMSEQPGRKLTQVTDKDFWDSLPKGIRALPGYYRLTPAGIEIWPMWPEYCEFPNVWVSP